MSKTNNLTDFLTNEANAIRTKKGYPSTQKINPQNFASEIASIKTYEGIPSDFSVALTRSSSAYQPYSITIKSSDSVATGTEVLNVGCMSDSTYSQRVTLSEGETVTVPIYIYNEVMTIAIFADDNVNEAEIIDDVSGATIARLNTATTRKAVFVVYEGVFYIVGTGADIS